MVKMDLVQSDGFAHGGLDVERFDVLPVLLQERNQEVDGQHSVGNQLIFSHLNVTDGNTKTENFLQLEFDGGSDFVGFHFQVVGVGDGSRKFTGFVETRTQQTGDLFDEDFGSKESVVFLGELLDELLVLVQFLEIFNGHTVKTDFLGLIVVKSVSKNADLHFGAGNIGELDGTRETLVSLGIVVLETDLEFDGFGELAGLFLRTSKNGSEGFTAGGCGYFAHDG